MKVIRGKTTIPGIKASVVTLGNFDGVHLGHGKILKSVVKRARAIGANSIIYTFEPHPLKVIAPKKSPPLITTLERKIKRISAIKPDYLVLANFTKEFAATHPKEFAEKALKKTLRAKEVRVGHDFSFGKRKLGTAESLKKLGNALRFKVFVIPAYKKDGSIVSSSRIRTLVKNGEVFEANRLLGYPFSLTGRVVKGRSVGKKLGFPTANIKTDNELLPCRGVYAAYAVIGKKRRPAVVNIGTAPTFKRGKTIIEAHILGFKCSIYGRIVLIEFMKMLRPEERFKNKEELSLRIKKDVKAAGMFLLKRRINS
ncbi:MAG: bifunctional riboflavin kinase/FAD synthetase [Deltaproteobacteria bacterium]